MIELIGENDSSEINDGKLLIKLRDEVVVEAGDGEVENDAMLVDEVGEVVIVVKLSLMKKMKLLRRVELLHGMKS